MLTPTFNSLNVFEYGMWESRENSSVISLVHADKCSISTLVASKKGNYGALWAYQKLFPKEKMKGHGDTDHAFPKFDFA